ncbi:putative Fe-S protein YdhL (DUF1289 family) [Bradyrhizobium sp. GM22.5]
MFRKEKSRGTIIKAWLTYPRFAMWVHAKDGRRLGPRTPKAQASMNKSAYRRFAFRTHAHEIAEWNRVAKNQKKSLSAFIREAAHRHKAAMSNEELNQHLIEMRRLLNMALQVRTPEQKNNRIERVRDHMTAMLHRANKIRTSNTWVLPDVEG